MSTFSYQRSNGTMIRFQRAPSTNPTTPTWPWCHLNVVPKNPDDSHYEVYPYIWWMVANISYNVYPHGLADTWHIFRTRNLVFPHKRGLSKNGWLASNSWPCLIIIMMISQWILNGWKRRKVMNLKALEIQKAEQITRPPPRQSRGIVWPGGNVWRSASPTKRCAVWCEVSRNLARGYFTAQRFSLNQHNMSVFEYFSHSFTWWWQCLTSQAEQRPTMLQQIFTFCTQSFIGH